MLNRFSIFLSALVIGAFGVGMASAQSLNPGYKVVLEPGEVRVTLDGKVVLSIEQDLWDRLFQVQGVRDMTGNGHANLAVIWRQARSAAGFVFVEMQPGKFVVVHEEQGMTSDILSTYGHLSDEQASALARGESLSIGSQRRQLLVPNADESSAIPASRDGHWAFIPGSWDHGTSGELGWVAQGDVEDSYSQIRFRCPDNGDDIWILVDRQHDEKAEVPEEVVLYADGMEVPLRLMPQISDETGYWYPIGMVGRETDLFSRLSEAGSVEMTYGDERVTLIENGPQPQDRAALSMFITRCDMSDSQ